MARRPDLLPSRVRTAGTGAWAGHEHLFQGLRKHERSASNVCFVMHTTQDRNDVERIGSRSSMLIKS